MNLWLQTNEELNGTNIYYFLTRDPPQKKGSTISVFGECPAKDNTINQYIFNTSLPSLRRHIVGEKKLGKGSSKRNINSFTRPMHCILTVKKLKARPTSITHIVLFVPLAN